MNCQAILSRFQALRFRKGQKVFNHSFLKLPVDVLFPPHLSFEGEIIAENLVRVEGKVKGTVKSPVVVIAGGARTIAEVEAECLYVEGNFQGIARVHFFYLDATGSVEGEIKAETIYVDKGARMKGKITAGKKEGV
ncbi:MAG: polymer-forming cytoskeletal protein [Candidatus Atribacteria bacterium]|nr:polymer-forming cytoskeletal protein [Candidatus Atribacteria bacterium]